MSNLRRLRRSVTPTDADNRPGAALVAGRHYPGPGAHNAYRCDDCGSHTVVVHRDEGVTPMFLGCRATDGCRGRAVSLGYPNGPIPPHLLPATHEWYRPDRTDPILRDPALRDHIQSGGLALRRVRPSDLAASAPDRAADVAGTTDGGSRG